MAPAATKIIFMGGRYVGDSLPVMAANRVFLVAFRSGMDRNFHAYSIIYAYFCQVHHQGTQGTPRAWKIKSHPAEIPLTGGY